MNTNRYAYTNFIGKSYADKFGAPVIIQNLPNIYNDRQRTIVRTINPNGELLNHVPINGLGNITNYFPYI